MNTEQKKLALDVVSQLLSYPKQVKRQVQENVNRLFYVTEQGARQNGVEVTAADLEATAGPEVWADILAQKAALTAFANQ